MSAIDKIGLADSEEGGSSEESPGQDLGSEAKLLWPGGW